MPQVGLYVTKADKAFLDQLPEGVTGAQLLREAIAAHRRKGEDCGHPNLVEVCPDCGFRRPVDHGDPMSTADDSGSPHQQRRSA